jgi:hypothetical protein
LAAAEKFPWDIKVASWRKPGTPDDEVQGLLVFVFFSCISCILFAADAESGVTGAWTAHDVGFTP